MKLLKYALFFTVVLGYIGCGSDDSEDESMSTAPVYSIAIMSPTTDDKNVNDDVHVHVNFDEAAMGTVHHANVKIYEKGNEGNIIFDGPSEAHVHEESGHFELHADIKLDSITGVEAHSDWIVKAKVWGHEAGAAEVEEEIEFRVHPE